MSPSLQLILLLLLVIGAAKLGGTVSAALGQPTVLGKLLAGVILGPSALDLLHMRMFSSPHLPETLHSLAELGVIFLMFMAGLRMESAELREAGKAASLTASLGVLVPFLGGMAAALAFGFGLAAAVFVGLLLTATSVSISAQTLLELGKLRTRVGTAMLGAAVLDDILGLLLLSMFFASQSSGGGAWSLLLLVGRLTLFLGGALLLGRRYLPRLVTAIRRWSVSEPVLTMAVLVILALAFGAEQLGSLAAITGAFLAGLLLAQTDAKDEIDRAISPFTYAVLVPVFFVGIGLNTDLRALRADQALLALALCAVAVATKIVGCGLGARLAGLSGRESLQVGAGMVSRGEVGLIIAGMGVQQGVIGADVFSVMVVVVLVTTLATPVLLRLSFRSLPQAQQRQGEEPELVVVG
ncbi:MAG TPA: cation:proton antiporter [Herpetosiphonaceae bacterium]